MLTRIVCITTAPVFFCAAIYVLLAKTQVTSSHLLIAKSKWTNVDLLTIES